MDMFGVPGCACIHSSSSLMLVIRKKCSLFIAFDPHKLQKLEYNQWEQKRPTSMQVNLI